MKKLLNRLKQLSKKQKIIIAVVLLLIIAAAAAFALTRKGKDAEPEQPPQPTYSQLMGIEVEPEVAERPILAVMIENSPDARPQTGISSAGIVFESVTEGGITRYLTMFQENFPKDLGPVRSVRPYFVNWLMGFDASVAHVGGSAEALDLLESRNAKTLNQFYNPGPYRRVADRAAPHNMYASTKALRDLQEKLGHKTAKFDEIPRSADSPAETPDAIRIKISYSYADYDVEFRYDKATNTYKRFLAGSPDIDAATKKQITVKNLVVLKMKGGNVDAIGNGTAIIYKDGKTQTVKWRQPSFRERVKLVDDQGNEIALNRGNTWFAVLPRTGSVTH